VNSPVSRQQPSMSRARSGSSPEMSFTRPIMAHAITGPGPGG
jgi:hypothetical protein